MARLADSERTIWDCVAEIQQKNDQIRQMSQEYLSLERVVAALARRQAGALVLDEAELEALPERTAVCQVTYPDGRVVIRVVTDESESGIAG